MPLPRRRRLATAILALGSAASSPALQADTPIGWITGDHPSAYTTDARSLEATAETIRVDDTIDFLDIRDEMIAGNRRLVDNSGDLDGWQGTIRVGIFEPLSLFYQRQEHALTLKLGEISSLNVLAVDEALETTYQEGGFKWMIYQADLGSANGEFTAASVELTWLESETEDFDLTFDRVSLRQGGSSGSISFTDPQTASVDQLQDEGWRARFIYTTALAPDVVTSLWAGYSVKEATSGTGSSIPLESLREALTQRFEVEERQYQLGFSLNWQIRPRLPLQLSYEYTRLHDQDITAIQGEGAAFILPSFLSASNLSQDDTNHVLSGSLSWWLTPQVNVGLTGKLFSNQFLGRMPHYNNPLSASFSDTAYGYIGLRLGARFGGE